MSIFPGPVAPESNPPINPQYYNPSRFVISAVALGQTTTITTTQDVNYFIGQQIRLIIPPPYGCRQLNERTGIVLSIPSSNQIVVSIDSSQNVDSYVSSSFPTKAQVLPIGDVNSGQINTSGRVNNLTYINGSFINVSPE